MELTPINIRPMPQAFGLAVLREQVAHGEESHASDVQTRVANALAENETSDRNNWRKRFLGAQRDGFIPAGPIYAGAGIPLQTTLTKCFVQPIGDSFDAENQDLPGIYQALSQAMSTMRRGGAVGYDFSRIRPVNSPVQGTGATSGGPVAFIRVFNEAVEPIGIAGGPRGTQMGILRCDHPDIEQFVAAKSSGEFSNFTLSIAASDAFMESVRSDSEFELVHAARPPDELIRKGAYQRQDGKWVFRVIRARQLWDRIMQTAFDWPDFGISFIDRANNANNLAYCEVLEAIDPCAKQWLPAYGTVCAGSINLSLLVEHPFTRAASFNFKRLESIIRTAVRMLDNALDCTHWPLDGQRAEGMSKRRLGLSYIGLADVLLMMGMRYDSDGSRKFASEIAKFFAFTAYRSSIELAIERGPFPFFDADGYLAPGTFASTLPDDIKAAIRQHGTRNSHLLSFAPDGATNEAFADNASNGIHPVVAWLQHRTCKMPDGKAQPFIVENYAYRMYRLLGHDISQLPAHFVTALDITTDAHEKMVAAVAPWVDSACNPMVRLPHKFSYEDLKAMYLRAWESGLNGLAPYRDETILGAVRKAATQTDEATWPDGLSHKSDCRIVLSEAPAPTLTRLHRPERPELNVVEVGRICVVESLQGRCAGFGTPVQRKVEQPFNQRLIGSDRPCSLGDVVQHGT